MSTTGPNGGGDAKGSLAQAGYHASQSALSCLFGCFGLPLYLLGIFLIICFFCWISGGCNPTQDGKPLGTEVQRQMQEQERIKAR
jgi:hypothetical protein